MSLSDTTLKARTPVTLSVEARERVERATPKKRRIEIVSDRDDAMRRVEQGELPRKPPQPTRELAANHASGTAPAARAMQRAEQASGALLTQQFNIIRHFVVLAKRLEQSTADAVVAEAALDLARTGAH